MSNDNAETPRKESLIQKLKRKLRKPRDKGLREGLENVIDTHHFRACKTVASTQKGITVLGMGRCVALKRFDLFIEIEESPGEHLGEHVSLPPNYEHVREQVEKKLTPLPNPREQWSKR